MTGCPACLMKPPRRASRDLAVCLFALSCLLSVQAAPARVVEPVFGTEIDWDALPHPEFELFCGSEPRDRRVLASTDIGSTRLAFVLTLVPIHADTHPEIPAAGYEVDSGQLVKRIGARATQLGASSGHLADDYPELREDVLRSLLRNLVRTLSTQYPHRMDFARAIAASPVCTDLDALTRSVLDEHGIVAECTASSQ
jgi:hypothetical protein